MLSGVRKAQLWHKVSSLCMPCTLFNTDDEVMLFMWHMSQILHIRFYCHSYFINILTGLICVLVSKPTFY